MSGIVGEARHEWEDEKCGAHLCMDVCKGSFAHGCTWCVGMYTGMQTGMCIDKSDRPMSTRACAVYELYLCYICAHGAEAIQCNQSVQQSVQQCNSQFNSETAKQCNSQCSSPSLRAPIPVACLRVRKCAYAVWSARAYVLACAYHQACCSDRAQPGANVVWMRLVGPPPSAV